MYLSFSFAIFESYYHQLHIKYVSFFLLFVFKTFTKHVIHNVKNSKVKNII